jgi:hypothetical protein
MYDRILTTIATDDVAAELRDECDTPGFGGHECAETNDEGYATGNAIQIVWYPEYGRAGLIYVGSGSSGWTVWTDASSPEDALRRYLDDDIAN